MKPDAIRQNLVKLQSRRASGIRSAALAADIARHQMVLGQYEAAEKSWREALSMEPGNPAFATSLAEVMMSLHYYPQALHLMRQVDKAFPSTASAGLIGVCLSKLGQTEQAEIALRKALKLDAKNLTAIIYLAGLLWDQSRQEEASGLLAQALKLSPDHPPALLLKAKILRERHKPAESLPLLKKLMDMPQYHAFAASLYANACIDLGDFEEAEAVLQGLRQSPVTRPRALYLISTIGKRPADEAYEADLKAVLARRDLVPQDRIDVYYAYSKYCDDNQRYGEAIGLAREAKKFEQGRFSLEGYRDFVQANIEGMITRKLEMAPPDYQPDARFVFIIGMPRSGTTLTEQTIAKLPGGVSLGEQDYFRVLSRKLGISGDPKAFVERVLALSAKERGEMARGWHQLCRSLGEGDLYVDKMPHNYEIVPLIRLCFPKAKFVWCQRNPVDNCISIYLNRFAESHAYSNQLFDLGQYYREHERLMAHWQTVPQLSSFKLNYETFVSDGGKLKEALLDFVAPGAAAAGEADGKQTVVRTFSRWQARQPIYQSSVERWRRYDGHIDDLLRGLNWPRENS